MQRLTLAFTIVTCVLASQVCEAHTITLGYTPGANPGDLNLWIGTYNHGSSNVPEGSAKLTGVNGTTYGPTTMAFDSSAFSLPSGLIENDNYFLYPYTSVGSSGDAFNDVVVWQGVTFSGLAAGDYTFEFIEATNPTATWSAHSGLQGVTLTFDNDDTGGGGMNTSAVPEPTSMVLLGLTALGGMGVGYRRRRKGEPTEEAQLA